jgi:hypothetical protein
MLAAWVSSVEAKERILIARVRRSDLSLKELHNLERDVFRLVDTDAAELLTVVAAMVVRTFQVGELHKCATGEREPLFLFVPTVDSDTWIKAGVNLFGPRDEVRKVSELLAEHHDSASFLPNASLEPNLMRKRNHLDWLGDEHIRLAAALLTAEQNLERRTRKGHLLTRERLPKGLATIE